MVTNLNETFAAVQAASRELAILDDTIINQILNAVADAAIAETPFILAENEKDLARMDKNDPKYDRLKLTEERLKDIATDTRNVATLPSPLGRVLKETIRPNGMKLTKISVPFGAIGIIYEARPNVSFDVFSLCLKSGNACVLKGGSDADYSNRAIICVIHEVLKEFNINPHIVELLPAEWVCFDKSGKNFLYQDRKGFEDEWRKHHTSSITRDIWLYNTQSGKHTNLTNREGEDRNPVYAPDGNSVYFLSERNGAVTQLYDTTFRNILICRITGHPRLSMIFTIRNIRERKPVFVTSLCRKYQRSVCQRNSLSGCRCK